MLPAVAAKPKIAIVGAGGLGSALAKELTRAGYSISEVIARANPASLRRARKLARSFDARPATVRNATCDAGLIWLCVPDRAIAAVGRELAAISGADGNQWKGRTVFHSSGALSSDELSVLRKKGAAVASVHPFMTFVRGSIPSLRGLPFAVEGDAAAIRLARQIAIAVGGSAFAVRKQDKAAYHAWATCCSPLLVAALVTAEQTGRLAGFSPALARRMMLPIVKQTIANYGTLGPSGAFSGPIVRGDAATVSEHLKKLRTIPEARAVYLALARSALRHLPVRNREQIKKVLDR
jgi:predicted short-subunit dehydrogenase-like oxidoreductase (DUF2520 family)